MSDKSKLKLSKCKQCSMFQFPPRELCSHCLSEDLTWEVIDPYGVVIAETLIHYSLEAPLEKTLPNHIGLIKTDIGPTLFANLHEELKKGDRVKISADPGFNNRESYYAVLA